MLDDAGEKELIQQTNKLADERWTKLQYEHPELAKQAIQWAEEYKQNLERASYGISQMTRRRLVYSPF